MTSSIDTDRHSAEQRCSRAKFGADDMLCTDAHSFSANVANTEASLAALPTGCINSRHLCDAPGLRGDEGDYIASRFLLFLSTGPSAFPATLGASERAAFRRVCTRRKCCCAVRTETGFRGRRVISAPRRAWAHWVAFRSGVILRCS